MSDCEGGTVFYLSCTKIKVSNDDDEKMRMSNENGDGRKRKNCIVVVDG